MGNRQQPHSWCSVRFSQKSQYSWLYLYSENMHRLSKFRNNVCTLVLLIFVKLLIEPVKIAYGKSLGSSDSKKRWETHYRPSTSMQQEQWKSKWPTVRLDPNRKRSETRMPIEPSTITFYSSIPKLLKEGGCTVVMLSTSQINSLLFAIRL